MPGHGPVCGPEVIDHVRAYLKFVLDLARAATAARSFPAGSPPGQADLGQFARLADPERLVGNLHRAYADLADAPSGAREDVAAALADMVAYNGGRPLSCRA